MLHKKRHLLATVLLLTLAAILYFGAINPDKFGFYHDDGIYLVTAKALATGQGYKILSLPDEPWQTKYPPVFPLALSLLWRANPDFPGNLFLFSAFSVLSTIAFLALAAVYLLKKSFAGPIPVFLILLFTAFNWRAIILGTSILSESLYAALTICVLWVASSLGKKHTATIGFGLGILLALATLTRMAGVSLLAAVVLYALTRRQIRRYLLPIVLASTLIAAWFLWCYLHQPSSVGTHVAYYTNYIQDWHSLIQSDERGIQNSLLGLVSVMIGTNLLTLLANIPVVSLGIQISQLQNMAQSWQFPVILVGLLSLILMIIGFCKTRSIGNGLLHYYILAYLALHLLWPYTIYDRFLIPMLPFLLFFMVSGGIHILQGCREGRQIRQRWVRIASLVFSCAILASLITAAGLGLTFGIRDQHILSQTAYEEAAQEKRELTAWLKTNSREEDILICFQDPVYFLYAGTKAIRLPVPENGRSVPPYTDRLQGFLEENRGTLLLQTKNDFSLNSDAPIKRAILADVINHHQSDYLPVFSTSNQKSILYRVTFDSVPGNK